MITITEPNNENETVMHDVPPEEPEVVNVDENA